MNRIIDRKTLLVLNPIGTRTFPIRRVSQDRGIIWETILIVEFHGKKHAKTLLTVIDRYYFDTAF